MAKVTFIGAGSLVFTRNLCNDILLAPALEDSTITLMDVDPERLEQSRQIVQAMADKKKLPARIEATVDSANAIRGADYVVTTFQQGGLEAYESDIEIPRKYGVEQCVGDTLGPGGVFRALRSIPVLVDLCSQMDKLWHRLATGRQRTGIAGRRHFRRLQQEQRLRLTAAQNASWLLFAIGFTSGLMTPTPPPAASAPNGRKGWVCRRAFLWL